MKWVLPPARAIAFTKNDFLLIGDPCYAPRILGSPGGGGGWDIASRYKEIYGVMQFLRQKQYLWT